MSRKIGLLAATMFSSFLSILVLGCAHSLTIASRMNTKVPGFGYAWLEYALPAMASLAFITTPCIGIVHLLLQRWIGNATYRATLIAAVVAGGLGYGSFEAMAAHIGDSDAAVVAMLILPGAIGGILAFIPLAVLQAHRATSQQVAQPAASADAAQ